MLNNTFPHISNGPAWVFTSERSLVQVEVDQITHGLNEFFKQWTAHGAAVVASAAFIDNTVLIVAADQTKSDVTGCSKDKLYHIVQKLSADLGIDFMNRMMIPIYRDETIRLVHWNDMESMVQKNELSEDDVFIDGSLGTLQELRTQGLKTVKSMLVAT